MRLAFNLAILAVALFYGWFAFVELDLLTPNGRLGPGFFPRVIAVLLVLTLLYSLVVDRRHGVSGEESSSRIRDVFVFALLCFLFVGMMQVLGGLIAMIVYMLIALTVFNPGKHLNNVILSVLLPAGVYLMFVTWLNASLPVGVLRFL